VAPAATLVDVIRAALADVRTVLGAQMGEASVGVTMTVDAAEATAAVVERVDRALGASPSVVPIEAAAA
jgi:hypothetical protein